MQSALLYLMTLLTIATFNKEPKTVEVPTFAMNFYMMGMTEIDQEVTILINDNIEYLNQEFEGKIKFRLGKLFMDENHEYIPDLHTRHLRYKTQSITELLKPIEEPGTISVFLFDTYAPDGSDRAMLGFTPVLSRQHRQYKSMSPSFDRLFISYAGLHDMSTIIHEMGHFFGLSHPWEMHHADRELMGLHVAGEERNHMNYHPMVDHFTEEQLDRMQHFALQFRGYLVESVEQSLVYN